MGRNSKLTEVQWEQLHKRLLSGDPLSKLAKAFGVAKATISERFSENKEKLKSVAMQICETQQAFDALSVSEQRVVYCLADDLKAISSNLAGAAKYGSITSLRLSVLAHNQVSKISNDDPMASQGHIQAISALTKVANEAATQGNNMLQLAQKQGVSEKRPTLRVDRATVLRMAKAMVETQEETEP